MFDPASELEVACAGVKKISGDGSVEPSTDEPCGGVTFALSTYSSPDGGGKGQETPTTTGDGAPAVLLLEVSFSAVGSVDAGGRVEGGGPRGEMFRVRHASGASLDFVGPTVGALECAPDGVVGTVVTGIEPSSIAPSIPTTIEPAAGADDRGSLVVSGADRDVSSCAGRPGLNLKGELLNDGGSLIKNEAGDCCADCAALPECNVWVYCEGDCVDYAYHSCWLKRAAVGFDAGSAPDAWAASPEVPWTSGWFPPKRGVQPVVEVAEPTGEPPEEPEDTPPEEAPQ